MKTEELLAELRKREALKYAIISEIRVSERLRMVEFIIITDRTYSADDVNYAVDTAQKFIPDGARVNVKISKLVADEGIVARKILSIIRQKFPVVASFVRPDAISVERSEHGAVFSIEIGAREQGLFKSDGVLDAVGAELSKCFCGSFIGTVKTTDKEVEVPLEDDEIPAAEQEIPLRVFPVENYTEIDGGEKPKYAVYIADLPDAEDNDLVIGGEIVDVRERATSSGKPFYVFTLSDCSNMKMRVTYFTRKKTIEKIKELKAGDKIVCRGEYSVFNGKLSYTAKYINMGGEPEGYVPLEKPHKAVPAAYKAVKPQPFSDYNQASLYAKELPAFLKDNTFVIYDLETTGLNRTGVSGTFDSIIEIGAVKMVGGELVEKFSTFVALGHKLSKEIIDLTGITDEMLAGAPPISDAIADFYKFCDGCIMVGHNAIDFDSKFINHYAEQYNYAFTNTVYDTMDISKKALPWLTNNKLQTLADHYGITFNHHRAFDDALATAKIFIAMVTELDGKL